MWEVANTAGWSDQLKSLMEIDTRREGEDPTNGVGLDTIPEEDKPNGDGCVAPLSDLTASERCELFNMK